MYSSTEKAKKNNTSKKQKEKLPPLDAPILILILILVVFGLIMLYSASYAVGIYRFNDGTRFIRKQLVFAVGGLVAMYIASRIDYHIYPRFIIPAFVVTEVMLFAVFAFEPLNGAHRWINIADVLTFQPSEIAKFLVILIFAFLISKNHSKMGTFKYGILPFLIVFALIIPPILLETHLSASILIFSIGAMMMIIGGISWKWIAGAGTIGAVGGTVFFLFLDQIVPYAGGRISTWLDPYAASSDDAHQIIQSMLAIGSGGLTGLGLGNSRQKHLYVPEPANDFIFSIICEELGFIGATIVILLFIALFLRGVYIAYHAKDRFGAMLVMGISFQIILQTFLNIAVVTNTIPNTGISLPFFSHGGTSLFMLLAELGILLNVSRQAKIEKT